jgi:hypothetical protein
VCVDPGADRSYGGFVLPAGGQPRWFDTRQCAIREDTPSMEDRSTAAAPAGSDATEFVRFCYRRRRVGWPELYDEMWLVANRRLFRGLGPGELADCGIGFSLFDTLRLADLAAAVIVEEQARRPPTIPYGLRTPAREPDSVPVVAEGVR